MRFTCEKFDRTELALALGNQFTSPLEIIRKNHFDYFVEYLGPEGIKAKTIVTEFDYINLDYLIDYTKYYAQCYQKYPKTCKRVHFFSTEFSKDVFSKIISLPRESAESIEFWKDYLGYIVVRPIPQRIIGTTLLKTYEKEEIKDGKVVVSRDFFGCRTYDVHIFGNKCSINSLAFQEQDRILSACATAAIWSMLHKASNHHYATLKTPSEITNDADVIGTYGERLFPNDGLSVLQISKAIQKAGTGMVTEIRPCEDKDSSYVKRIIRAYAPIGIPILLALKVPQDDYGAPLDLLRRKWESVKMGEIEQSGQETTATTTVEENKGQLGGLHLTTVCGYRWAKFKAGEPKKSITWRSDALEKLYVHDDQWGPFARMEFTDSDKPALLTNWSEKSGSLTPVNQIIIPLYHKIRIKFDEIESLIKGLDFIFWMAFIVQLKYVEDISWDVYVDYSENFKDKIKKHTDVILVEDIIQKSLPKYMWIVNCFLGDKKIMTIGFDATDLAVNMYAMFAVFYDDKFKRDLRGSLASNKEISSDIIDHPAGMKFIDFLINKAC